MKKYFKKLIEKSFVRNVIIMATGTAAAQIVGLLLQPIITRLYGPEAYGLMGVFTAIVGVIIPIAALTYPIAIVLPRSDAVAKGLVRLSLSVTASLSFIVGIVLLLFNEPIIRLLQLEDIASFLYLIPLVVLSAGFLQVMEQWLIRTKQFSITAKVTFFQALILNGSKVGIGVFYPTASILIIASALGHGIKALMLFTFAKQSNYKQSSERAVVVTSVKELAKNYKAFPIFRAPEVFFDAVSRSLPILMLSIFFGPSAAGFYTISTTVLSIPSTLISKSVGDVFYPRIAEAGNNGENLTRLIKKTTFGLGAIGIIPFGTIIIFGPWLFSFVFGEEWKIAGEYARWIAFGSFFIFINRPSITALPVMSAQAFHLVYTVFKLIMRISALIIGYYIFASDLVAIALYGLSGVVLNSVLILITLHISKKFDDKKNL